MSSKISVSRRLGVYTKIVPTINGVFDPLSLIQTLSIRTQNAGTPLASLATATWPNPVFVQSSTTKNGICTAIVTGANLVPQRSNLKFFKHTIGFQISIAPVSLTGSTGTDITNTFVLNPAVPQWSVAPTCATQDGPLPPFIFQEGSNEPVNLVSSGVTATPAFPFVETHAYNTEFVPSAAFFDAAIARIQSYVPSFSTILAAFPGVVFGAAPGQFYLLIQAAITTDVSFDLDPLLFDNLRSANSDLYIISSIPAYKVVPAQLYGYVVSGTNTDDVGTPAGSFNRGVVINNLTKLKTGSSTVQHNQEIDVSTMVRASVLGVDTPVPITIFGDTTMSLSNQATGSLIKASDYASGTITTI